MHKQPSIEAIADLRKRGLRPGVVGCFIHNKKLLIMFNGEHKLWMLPQGGIRTEESLDDTLKRETHEELGEGFAQNVDFNKGGLVFEDEIKFSTPEFKGKYYYYVTAPVLSEDVDISNTQFEDFAWVDYETGSFIAKRISQRNKGNALQALLELLRDKNLIK